MAGVQDLIMIGIFLAIVAIISGTIFITGLGTFANGTAGNACKNCQASTKTMLQTTELAFPLALFVAVIGSVLAAVFAIRGRAGR